LMSLVYSSSFFCAGGAAKTRLEMSASEANRNVIKLL
jgi:hypothetical protein